MEIPDLGAKSQKVRRLLPGNTFDLVFGIGTAFELIHELFCGQGPN